MGTTMGMLTPTCIRMITRTDPVRSARRVATHTRDPALLSGDRSTGGRHGPPWRRSAPAACSGALIVLTFAFLNGLWSRVILSVLAMAVGTAITVSLLRTLAVTAKNWAVAMAGDGRTGNPTHAAIRSAGRRWSAVLGLLLLTASLTA